MKNLIKVVAVQDYDSHWYVIPKELESRFYFDLAELSEKRDTIDDFDEEGQEEMWDIVEALEGSFLEKYSKFATGGDLNCIQLYADIEND